MNRFARCVVVFSAGLILASVGCQKSAPNAPSTPQPESKNSSTTPPSVSKADSQRWLEDGLPAISEEIADAPVKLFNAKIEHNEFGQELLSISYERPKVVRTMAAQVTLVLLPANGGRQEVYVPNGIVIQPQNEGRINGITDQLLNHRGRVPTGLRAYLEMRAATINGTSQKAQRVSEVCWIGTDAQLAEAVKGGASANEGQSVTATSLKPAPGGKLFKGTPLWMKCGDRWTRGQLLNDSDADEVDLLVFLVRRDNPYMPWEIRLSRSDLRIEEAALDEFKRDPNSFQDLADSLDSKLSRMGTPKKLQRVNPDELTVNAPVLDFWNGMLDPCRVTGKTENGATPIQRVGLDNAQMTKPAKSLFVDPLAAPS